MENIHTRSLVLKLLVLALVITIIGGRIYNQYKTDSLNKRIQELQQQVHQPVASNEKPEPKENVEQLTPRQENLGLDYSYNHNGNLVWVLKSGQRLMPLMGDDGKVYKLKDMDENK